MKDIAAEIRKVYPDFEYSQKYCGAICTYCTAANLAKIWSHGGKLTGEPRMNDRLSESELRDIAVGELAQAYRDGVERTRQRLPEQGLDIYQQVRVLQIMESLMLQQ